MALREKKGISGVIESKEVERIRGPLLFVKASSGVAFDELVEVELSSGEKRRGRVLDVSRGVAVIQVFEGTTGISTTGTIVRFLGKTLELGVSEDMLGRIFNGLGDPIDGGPSIIADDKRDINGEPLNPSSRAYPKDFIQTGVSAIDGMNTLVRG
ncbi:MAG: HAS-barrel domain-containing protein, partial [Fervidicoccaceae archaeon]